VYNFDFASRYRVFYGAIFNGIANEQSIFRLKNNYSQYLHMPVYCSVLQCAAVCCSVLQCVAVCCSELQCVAVCCSVLQCAAVCEQSMSRLKNNYFQYLHMKVYCSVLQGAAVCCSELHCCSVLQCAAVCCSVRATNVQTEEQLLLVPTHAGPLQCVAGCCRLLQCAALCCTLCCRLLQCVAVCCSVLQCVAVCCSVLHYVAVCEQSMSQLKNNYFQYLNMPVCCSSL